MARKEREKDFLDELADHAAEVTVGKTKVIFRIPSIPELSQIQEFLRETDKDKDDGGAGSAKFWVEFFGRCMNATVASVPKRSAEQWSRILGANRKPDGKMSDMIRTALTLCGYPHMIAELDKVDDEEEDEEAAETDQTLDSEAISDKVSDAEKDIGELPSS